MNPNKAVTSRTKSGPCPVCGQKATRSISFSQDINPHLTREQAMAIANRIADDWVLSPEELTHRRCQS